MAKKKHTKDKPPPCHVCNGSCCRYVAMEIEKPKRKRDYDHIRWYLLHENVNVFIDHDDEWFVEFKTECEALGRHNQCMVYETRPRLCRDHGEPPDVCEYHDEPHIQHFATAAQLEGYLDRKKIDWRWRRM